jgi:hypothetical protein
MGALAFRNQLIFIVNELFSERNSPEMRRIPHNRLLVAAADNYLSLLPSY